MELDGNEDGVPKKVTSGVTISIWSFIAIYTSNLNILIRSWLIYNKKQTNKQKILHNLISQTAERTLAQTHVVLCEQCNKESGKWSKQASKHMTDVAISQHQRNRTGNKVTHWFFTSLGFTEPCEIRWRWKKPEEQMREHTCQRTRESQGKDRRRRGHMLIES